MSCEHLNFEAAVDTHRLSQVDGGPITSYAVDLRLRCADCGLPFRFIVPDVGLLPDRAAKSVNGEELHVYAEPSDGSLVESLRPGYRVTMHDGSKPSKN